MHLKSFAFYSNNAEDYSFLKPFNIDKEGNILSAFSEDHIRFFYDNQLFNKSDFDGESGDMGYFTYQCKSKDFDIIFSTVNLWRDVPEGYNVASYDYITEKEYEYTLDDLASRYNILFESNTSYVFKSFILELEKTGKAEAISITDGAQQYFAQYGTKSAFPYIAQAAAEWSQDIAAAYFLRRMVAEYGLVLMNEVVKQLGREAIKKLIQDKGKDFIQGAIIDYGLQATFNYVFADIPFSEAASPENINWISVGAAGLENTLSYNKKYAEYGIALSFACFVNGWTEAGGFKDDFDVTTCAVGVVSAGLGKQVPFIFKYTKKYASLSISKLKTRLAKINITGKHSDEIIAKIKNNADDILSFKAGESLSVYVNKSGEAFDCLVENVRPGTNGKYVVMGRSMGPVSKVADDLKALGLEVRILDDDYLSGLKFNVGNYEFILPSGKKVIYNKGHKIYDRFGNIKYELTGNDEWTVDMAWNDMVNNPAYREIKDADGFINNVEELKNLPMYKLNKQWIEKMKNEGYEVINIGNPTNEATESLFFNMEKSVMSF